MTKTAVITARVDCETRALIDKVVKSQGRSRSWFAAQAIRRVAEEESDYLTFVQAGIDAADAGELIPQDGVFCSIRDNREQRTPE